MNSKSDIEFSNIEKYEARKAVFEELTDYSHTPLKRVVKELAAYTMDIKPDICGVNVVHLKRDIKDCIKRINDLEAEMKLTVSQLMVMHKQLEHLSNLTEINKDVILGKLVVLKDEVL